MTRILLAFIISLLALPAMAQQVTGSITSGDLTWYLISQDQHSKSKWRGDETTAIITLFGHASPDTVKEFQGALTIQFYLFEPMGAQVVNEVDIVYYKDAAKGAYVTKGHGAGSIITLQQVALSDGTLTVTGDFNVTLLFTDDFGVTLDETDTTHITGRFNAVLTHE